MLIKYLTSDNFSIIFVVDTSLFEEPFRLKCINALINFYHNLKFKYYLEKRCSQGSMSAQVGKGGFDAMI